MEQRYSDERFEEGNEGRSTEPGRSEEIRIPVIQEHITIDKQEIETGKVIISKTVSQHDEPVHVITSHDECKVEHVPAGYYVEQPPAMRQDGDITIIPVVREEAVVVKKLFLVEEIHVTRVSRQTQDTQYVNVRTEHVDVQRLSADEKERPA